MPEPAEPGPKPTPYLSIIPTSDPLTVTLRYVGHTGPFALHYGDGTGQLASGNRSYRHTYERPGAYTAVARADGNAALLDAALAVVRSGSPAAPVEWGPSPDNPEIWRAGFVAVAPEQVPPHLAIDWGDDTTDRVWAIPGTMLEHPLPAGDHTVAVTDLHTRRKEDTTQTVEPPSYDPDFTIAEVPGHDPRQRAKITMTVVTPGKPIMIDWGELYEDPQEVASAAAGDSWEYTYPTVGDKFPGVTYKDGSGAPNDQGFLQIPFTG